MEEKSPLNPNLVGLIHVLLMVGVASAGKNTYLNALLFAPVAVLCVHFVFFSASSSRTSDYVLSLTVVNLFFAASDFILLRNRQSELRKRGQKKPVEQMSAHKRLWWAATLIIAKRGVGWEHEPTNSIAPHPMKSRLRFIRDQLMWTIFYFLLFDIFSIVVRMNPCFGTGGPSLGAFGWKWRTTALLYPLLSAASLTMVYILASTVGVALRLSEPSDWPNLFGSLWDAYTVRNSWGRVWHQMLRKNLMGHMNVLAHVLGLPQGKFKSFFKLYGCFFISGLFHYAGDYMLFQNWTTGTSLRFFILQAVAITFEEVFLAVVRRTGVFKSGKVGRLVGYIWVFAWFTFSLPIWLDPILHAGSMDEGINVSLILGTWKGEWTPKRMGL